MRPECPHLVVARPFLNRSDGGGVRSGQRLFGRSTAAPRRRIGLARWLLGAAMPSLPTSFVCDICLRDVVVAQLPSVKDAEDLRSCSSAAEATSSGAAATPSRQATAASFRRALSGVLTRSKGGIGNPWDVARGVTRIVSSRKSSQRSHNERILAACREFPKTLLHPDVQQRALRMSRFAAAAYGPAYRDGFHSSVAANALLSLPLFYRRHVAVPSSAHCASAMQLLASSESCDSQEFVAVAANAVDAPCEASFVIFVDHGNCEVVVAFRGTTSRGDMLTDILPNLVPLVRRSIESPPSAVMGAAAVSGAPSGDDGSKAVAGSRLQDSGPGSASRFAAGRDGTGFTARAPEGFVRSVHGAMAKVTSMLVDVARQNAVCFRRVPYRLVLTGHSLGAIQANLWYLLVRHDTTLRDALEPLGIDMDKSCVYGFAPAPCLASWNTSENGRLAEVEREMHNFIFGLDVVPRLQTSSLRRVLRSDGRASAAGTDSRVGEDDDDELVIPGNVWWLDPSSRMSTSSSTPPREEISHGGQASKVFAHKIGLRLPYVERNVAATPSDRRGVMWNDVPLGVVAWEHHFLANLCRALWGGSGGETL